jgi:hypothetical protein
MPCLLGVTKAEASRWEEEKEKVLSATSIHLKAHWSPKTGLFSECGDTPRLNTLEDVM